jgi:hypothetical protein
MDARRWDVVCVHVSSGRLTTIGVSAPHDPSEKARIRRIDLHVRQEGRHVNEIAGARGYSPAL